MEYEHSNDRRGRFLTVSAAAGMVQSGRSTIPIQMGCLTNECRPSHRPDVAFVESLVAECSYAIKTRRSNGNVAFVGLIITTNPRINTSSRAPYEPTFKASFTYSSGPSIANSDNLRPSYAKSLNPVPGNHSGTYLTLGVNL